MMTIRSPLPNEDELIRSAQQGKLESFTTLYEYYLPVVYNRVRYIVPEEDVEDVTQEIFIATIHCLKSFRGEAKFSTWLRTLTNRQVANYYRKRKVTAPLDEHYHTHNDPPLTDDAILIRQAFRKLPTNYREVLLLRFAENMSFQEIACLQHRNLEAVKSLFRRAFIALQKQVNPNG